MNLQNLRCKVTDGLTMARYDDSKAFTIPCEGRASQPWKVLHIGASNRVSMLVKNALGYMLGPGNYMLEQKKKHCAYTRDISLQIAFKKIRQRWPDLLCLDIPYTFGYMERFWTEEVWEKILYVFGDIPLITFDMNDRGDYAPMLPDNFMRRKSTLHFKREPWPKDQIELYPEDGEEPIPVWLGASCEIMEPVPWNKRIYNVMFWCNNTAPVRRDIFNALKVSRFWDDPHSLIYLENVDCNNAAREVLQKYGEKAYQTYAYPMLSYAKFGELMANTRVLMAPEGYGQFTHRHVEGLLSGCVVMSADNLSKARIPMKDAFVFPCDEGTWADLADLILSEENHFTWAEKTQLQVETALKYFSTTGFARYLGRMIEAGINKKS